MGPKIWGVSSKGGAKNFFLGGRTPPLPSPFWHACNSYSITTVSKLKWGTSWNVRFFCLDFFVRTFSWDLDLSNEIFRRDFFDKIYPTRFIRWDLSDEIYPMRFILPDLSNEIYPTRFIRRDLFNKIHPRRFIRRDLSQRYPSDEIFPVRFFRPIIAN